MTNPNDFADGMTIRDYFAVMALNGLLSDGKSYVNISEHAVMMADDLIAALNVDQNKRFSESINNADDDDE